VEVHRGARVVGNDAQTRAVGVPAEREQPVEPGPARRADRLCDALGRSGARGGAETAAVDDESRRDDLVELRLCHHGGPFVRGEQYRAERTPGKHVDGRAPARQDGLNLT
jgi:hypothetical protein